MTTETSNFVKSEYRYEVHVDGFCFYSSRDVQSAEERYAAYCDRWKSRQVVLRYIEVMKAQHYFNNNVPVA